MFHIAVLPKAPLKRLFLRRVFLLMVVGFIVIAGGTSASAKWPDDDDHYNASDNYLNTGSNPIHGEPHLTDWQSLANNSKIRIDGLTDDGRYVVWNENNQVVGSLSKNDYESFLVIRRQLHYTPEQKAVLGNNFIQDILNAFNRYTGDGSKMPTILTNAALRLFYLLAVIQLIWSFGMLFMQGQFSLQTFAALLLRQILIIGIFWFLISHCFTYATELKDYLLKLAGDITNATYKIPDVGDLFNKTVEFIMSLASSAAAEGGITSWGPYFYALACIVVSIPMALCMMYIILKVIMAYIQTYFAIAVSMLVMGLAGLEATRQTAVQSLYRVGGAIMNFFGIQLMYTIIVTVLNKWTSLAKGMHPQDCVTMALLVMCGSFVFSGLIASIPDFIAGFVGGAGMNAAPGVMLSAMNDSYYAIRSMKAAFMPARMLAVGSQPLISNWGGHKQGFGNVIRGHGAGGLAYNALGGVLNAGARIATGEKFVGKIPQDAPHPSVNKAFNGLASVLNRFATGSPMLGRAFGAGPQGISPQQDNQQRFAQNSFENGGGRKA